MRSFRFLHTADLHLGTLFQGLGRHLSTGQVKQLKEQAARVFERIVDTAIIEEVDFVTISGDIFDSGDVPMRVYFDFHRGLERLRQAGIRVFMSHGNHDPLRGASVLTWPDNVHVFPPAPTVMPANYVVPSVTFAPNSDTTVQISGFSYGDAEFYQPMAQYFQRDPNANLAIGLYHGMVEATSGDHANYCQVSVEELVNTGYDIWGLGHIHKPTLVHGASPLVLYPGNPQGRHIREAGERGVVVIDVSASGKTTWHRINTAKMFWEVISVPIEGFESVTSVMDRVLAQLQTLKQTGQDMEYVIRLRLTGATSLHLHLENTDEFRDSLMDAIVHQQLPVILERVVADTQPVIDIETILRSDDFLGNFLRRLRAYRGDIEAARRELLPLLKDVFHAGNELSTEDVSDADVVELLDLAERLALVQILGSEVTE